MENNLYQNYETKNKITNTNTKVSEKNNNEDYKTKFLMQERMEVKSFAKEQVDPMIGIISKSLLYMTYFSMENIRILQNGLRAGVYSLSKEKYVFPIESTYVNLQLIMKSIISRFGNYSTADIKKEIEMLNEKVLDYCIPFVYKAALSYEIFLEDQIRLILPLEHSIRSDRDYKQLHNRTW